MRSPLFMFAVFLLNCVCSVMLIGQMNAQTPTAGNYSVSGTPENTTQELLSSSMNAAPNYMIPGVFVIMGITMISFIFIIGRKR